MDYIKTSRYDNIVLPFNKNNRETIRLGYFKSNKRFWPIFIFVHKNSIEFINNHYEPDKIKYYIVIDKIQLKKLHNLFKKWYNNGHDDYKNYKQILIDRKLFNKPIILLTEMFNIDEQDVKFIFKSKNYLKSYKNLINKLESEFNFDFTKYRSIFSYIIEKSNYRNAKILKSKSPLDINFARLFPSGYSDIFKLLENRKDRLIYVLDVNSMFPYLLTKNIYPHPKYLEYSNKIDINKIYNGIFRVKIYIDNDIWLNKYNSLFYRFNNSTISLQYKIGDIIETYLSYSEVIFYKKYYKIDILEGIYSTKTIYSPLKKLVDKYFNRKNSCDDTILKSIYKTMLVTLSTSMNQNKLKKIVKIFKNIEEMKNYFKNKYLIDIRDNIYYDSSFLKIIDIKEYNNYIKVIFLINNFKHSQSIYSISNIMYSEARVEMLKYIELFLNSSIDLDICYINIDSIHISIDKKYKDKFEKFLSNNNLIGNQLGQLKIEAIGNSALWLEVGNYWIINNNKVVKYSSLLPKKDKIKDPFKNKVIEKSYDQYGNILYKKYDLFKSIRYLKNIRRIDQNNIYLDRIQYNNNIEDITILNYIQYENIYKEVFKYYYNLYKKGNR